MKLANLSDYPRQLHGETSDEIHAHALNYLQRIKAPHAGVRRRRVDVGAMAAPRQ